MNEDMLEKIEQYLNDELNETDRSNFESELSTNIELASKLELYKTIEREMRNKEKHDEDERALKNTLEEFNNSYFKNQKKITSDNREPQDDTSTAVLTTSNMPRKGPEVKRMKVWKQLAMAAGILGIVALGVTWYLRNKTNDKQIAVNDKKIDSSTNPKTNITKPDTIHLNPPPEQLANENNKKVKSGPAHQSNDKKREQLFAANFKPDTLPENREGPLEDAFAYYETGDFKDAIAAIETADLNMVIRGQETDMKQRNFYAHYYKALCFMADSTVAKAIPELQKAIVESPDSTSQIKAQWYLALSYIKTGDLKKAEELLKHVAEKSQNIEFKSKAEVILGKERNLKRFEEDY